MKVCLARVDRIGDLVLTLPVEYAWRLNRKDDEIEWLVQENLGFVMNHALGVSKAFYIAQPQTWIRKILACWRLRKKLLEKKFDEVVAFHVPWWVAFAFLLAKIPQRVGVASQWFSWICFNKRLRQKRSRAEKHESEYNLDLANFATQSTGIVYKPTELIPNEAASERIRYLLKVHKCDPEKTVVIHPGMGGSARNWPAKNYAELGRRLIGDGFSVVVTGSKTDQEYVLETGLTRLEGVLDLVGNTTGEEILAILSLATAVVAPSTGVAHLAASLGKKVIGLYSPVRVQAPKRWAPKGRLVRTLMPQVTCPGVYQCLGRICASYDCMEQITVDSVLAYVKEES